MINFSFISYISGEYQTCRKEGEIIKDFPQHLLRETPCMICSCKVRNLYYVFFSKKYEKSFFRDLLQKDFLIQGHGGKVVLKYIFI